MGIETPRGSPMGNRVAALLAMSFLLLCII